MPTAKQKTKNRTQDVMTGRGLLKNMEDIKIKMQAYTS